MQRRSFTLLETLLAVLIVALLATTVGYRYYRSADRTLLRSAGYRLLHVARYAHLTAAEKHHACTLHVNLSEQTYWLTARQSGIPVDTNATTSPDEEQAARTLFAQPRKLPQGVRFKSVQVEGLQTLAAGQSNIQFNPDGTAPAALIQLSKNQKTYTLLIYPWTGRAQLVGSQINELPAEMTDLDATETIK